MKKHVGSRTCVVTKDEVPIVDHAQPGLQTERITEGRRPPRSSGKAKGTCQVSRGPSDPPSYPVRRTTRAEAEAVYRQLSPAHRALIKRLAHGLITGELTESEAARRVDRAVGVVR